LRDIIKQARQVGVLANDQKILSMCDDLEKKVDKLSALRSQGLVCNTCNIPLQQLQLKLNQKYTSKAFANANVKFTSQFLKAVFNNFFYISEVYA